MSRPMRSCLDRAARRRPSAARAVGLALALALTGGGVVVSGSGCDVAAAPTDAGTRDATWQVPDVWDPGPKPSGSCSYGYGEDCPAAAVDCDLQPCVHGTCLRGDAGVDACICDPGYAGVVCDTCAPGYRPAGLACVADDPCSDGPCVYGTCYPTGSSFSCECQTGYAGTRCDECASGYHVEDLQCVPD
jgi:hypothetical protein